MVKESEEDKKKKAKPKAKPKEERKEEPKAEVHKEVRHEAHAPKAEAPKAEAAPAVKTEAAKPKKRKGAPKKPETKVFVARGKRKESVARATITQGKGVIRINSQKLESLNNPYIRDIIREPLRYIGPEANSVDISVNVNGGGAMGQAQAARTAIANALWMYFDQMNLRKKFVEIDRSLVIEDTRRVETKKFRGPKARARFQKSYR
ncbi:MAG: 30S ribosomal protein S9 [Candidatus Micrarchaeota archaeon]